MTDFKSPQMIENQSQSNDVATKGTEDHKTFDAALEKITYENRQPFRIDTSDSEQTHTYNDFLEKDKNDKKVIIKGPGEIDLGSPTVDNA